MKKIALILWLIGTLASRAGTAPAFPTGTTTFVNAFTNNAQIGNSRAVVLADIFGNGHPALIAANSTGDTLSVLTNNGSGVFGLYSTLNVGVDPYALIATNVNGSGYVDLLCLNENASTVSVLTNNGAGAFTLSDTVAMLPNSEATAFTVADLYHTGKPAFIAGSLRFGTLTIFTNTGGGIFGSNATFELYAPAPAEPVAVTAVDVNGDGWADLVCVSQEAGVVSVLTNNANGSFRFSDNFSVPVSTEPASVAVADIFNNGRPALITALTASTLFIYTNAGGGIFGSNASYNAGLNVDALAAVDVNGDGSLDLVAASYGNSTLTVLTNNGNGQFAAASSNSVAVNPFAIAAGNIFGNGKVDLALATANGLDVISNQTAFYQRSFRVGQFTNLSLSATGSPTPAFTTTTALPGGITLADHGNGTATLGGTPVIGSGGIYTIALKASNTSGIASQTVTLIIDQPPIFPGYQFAPASTNVTDLSPVNFVAADVFNNGWPDLVYPYIVSTQPGGFTVLDNYGGGQFSAPAINSETALINALLTADVYGTGHPAVIGYDTNADTIGVYTNNGSGVFGLNQTLAQPASPQSIVAADFSGTGKLALLCGNNDATITIYTNNGLAFHAQVTNHVGAVPVGLVAADLNGDGHPDVAYVNENTDVLTVLTNNGSGLFPYLHTFPLPNGEKPFAVLAADIFNNGQPALIAPSSNPGFITVFTNAGGGNFSVSTNYPDLVTTLATADINNDGYLDLVGSSSSDVLLVLTNNGAGLFSTANLFTPYLLDNPAKELVTADVNRDGRVDVISASTVNEGELTVYTNGPPTLAATFFENGSGVTYTPPPASGYPLPAASFSSPLPPGLTFANGVLGGTPNPGTAGSYLLEFTATNLLGTTTQTLNLTIVPVVRTTLFSVAADENTPLNVSTTAILTHDSDQDGYPLSVIATSGLSQNGGQVGVSPGVVTYTPATGFTGSDLFTYTAADTLGDSAQGTVYVTVYARPVAGYFILSTPENTPLIIPATETLNGASDPAGEPLSLASVTTSPYNSLVALTNSASAISYTPATNFTGEDNFNYTLADPLGGTANGLAVIVVTAPGSPAYNTAALTAGHGQLTLQYTGVPHASYYLQTAPAVTGPWTDASGPTPTADANGLITIPIGLSPTTPAAYYRISANP